MEYCLITFRSVTPAQRGEGALRRSGLSCTLQRTPKWMEEQGCGYSLRVRPADVENAVSILRKQRIAYRKVYHYEQGQGEELSL